MDVKPPVLVGIAAALLILLAALLAPYLRAGNRKVAEKAQEKAQLALRELARVDLALPRVDKLADTGALKPALDSAVQAAATEPAKVSSGFQGIGPDLQRISADYAARLRAAIEFAKQRGLRPRADQPIAGNLVGAQGALSELQKTVLQNNALLTAAITDAQAAVAEGASASLNPVGVAHVLGMAQYVRAQGLLAESEELRRRQADAQARLILVGGEWKLAQGYLDHYRGLDVVPILARLRNDLKELSGLREEANAAVAKLTEQTEKAKSELKEVGGQLQAARRELLALEEKGFVRGQDDSFNAYRTRYLEITRRLQELQQREQEVTYGGLRGAEVSGDDLTTAEMKGGETVVGLEELNRRLATAQEKAKRLDSANVSLDEHIKYVTASGAQAEVEAKRYQQRLAELNGRLETIVEEIKTAATAAFTTEGAALLAALASQKAFSESQSAMDEFLRQRSDAQREADPDRKNELLAALLRDPYLKQVGSSSEAAARVLEGRIHAQRVESCGRLIDDMRLFGELKPLKPSEEGGFKAEPFRTALETARGAGIDTLTKAVAIYERLSGGGAPNTAWVPLAALAAAHHLMARIDEAQAGLHAGKAADYIRQAVENREQSPYLEPYVLFRDHMGGGTTSKPAGDEAETTAPAESQPGRK